MVDLRFRSEKLKTLLNWIGNYESHSFSLELETTLVEAVIQSSTLLSNQVIRSPSEQTMFHSEFDNFDQLMNDLTGKDSGDTAPILFRRVVSFSLRNI